MQSFSYREEASLGVLDYDAILPLFNNQARKNKKNIFYSDEEWYLIGKYASVNGPGATTKKFRKSQPI